MISSNEFHQAVYEALAEDFTFPDLDAPNLHENAVTGVLPEMPGRGIFPGVITQVRTASLVDEDALSGVQVLDARTHRLQTRVFAETQEHLRDAVDRVQRRLTGLRIGDYSLRHSTEDDPVQPHFRDPDLDRPYTYIYWNITG